MAGVPGVSIVVLLTTLSSMNIPAQGIALIIGVDRLLDMVRTCVNVIGNALSTVVIAKWENVYDKRKRSKLLKFNLKIYISDILEPLTIYDCKWLLHFEKCKQKQNNL